MSPGGATVTLQTAGPGCQVCAQLLCLVPGAPQLHGQCFPRQIMKLLHRDFTLFSNQAAPQWEESNPKLLIVLKFLPWELGGSWSLCPGHRQSWVQGFGGSR